MADDYNFVLECSALADELGYEAVWLPERHFHRFGGLFPNPSVVAAAVAVHTRRVGIRAGSVVAPLHPVARIAEEWAVVDRLSAGRAGLSLATGWNRADFAIARVGYDDRRAYTLAAIDQLRALWRGDEAAVEGPSGNASVRTSPRPVRGELPLWLTATSGPHSFDAAARLGVNVLTGYLQLGPEDLARWIARYRRNFRPPAPGVAPHVTVMLHTYVGEDTRDALRVVEEPLLAYQQAFLDLHERGHDHGPDGEPLTADERAELARYAAHKYATERGLVGGPEKAAARLGQLAAIGVDEVACLVDYGLPPDLVHASMRRLASVRAALARDATVGGERPRRSPGITTR